MNDEQKVTREELLERAHEIIFSHDFSIDEESLWVSSLNNSPEPAIERFIELCGNDDEALRQATVLLVEKDGLKRGGDRNAVLKKENAMLNDAVMKDRVLNKEK